MGGLLMLKILVAATLLLGTASLAYSFTAQARRSPRRRNPGITVSAVLSAPQDARTATAEVATGGKVRRSEEEWRARLTEEQYRVTRCGTTERPFTGRYWNHDEPGTYHCVGCDASLFSSQAKYEAGTGWPSFHRPIGPDAVDEIKDISYGVIRTEVVCRSCESHLGHVFEDGPQPTGRRYGINSAALVFVSEKDSAPEQKVG